MRCIESMGAAAGRAMAALHITCAARRIISVLPGGATASPEVVEPRPPTKKICWPPLPKNLDFAATREHWEK